MTPSRPPLPATPPPGEPRRARDPAPDTDALVFERLASPGEPPDAPFLAFAVRGGSLAAIAALLDVAAPLLHAGRHQVPWLAALSAGREDVFGLLLERYPELGDLAHAFSNARSTPLVAALRHSRWASIEALLGSLPGSLVPVEGLSSLAAAAVPRAGPALLDRLAARSSSPALFIEAVALEAAHRGTGYARKACTPSMRWAVDRGATCWMPGISPGREPAINALAAWPGEKGGVLDRWCSRQGLDAPLGVLEVAISHAVSACAPQAFRRLWALRAARAPVLETSPLPPLLCLAASSAMFHARKGTAANTDAWLLFRLVFATGAGRGRDETGATPLHAVLVTFLSLARVGPPEEHLLEKVLSLLPHAGYGWDAPDGGGATPRDYVYSPSFIRRAPQVAARLDAMALAGALPSSMAPAPARRF